MNRAGGSPRRLRLVLALLSAGLLSLSLCGLVVEPAHPGSSLARLLPAEEVARLERTAGSFDRRQEPVFVVLDGGATAWADERVVAVERELERVPGVARASEPLPLRRLRRDPTLRMLSLTLAPELRLDEARRVSRALEDVLAGARREGERAYVAGWPRFSADSSALVRLDLARVLPLLACATLAVPWVFLGSPGAGVFALLVAACTTALTLWGLQLACGAPSPVALAIVPLPWAAAAMHALHLAGRARALAARGLSRDESARRARAELAVPCLATGLTGAAGLGALGAVARAGLLRDLGLASAAGLLLAYLLAFGPCVPLLALVTGEKAPPRWPSALGTRAMRRVRRSPGRWIAVWALLALGALAGFSRLRVSTAFPRLFSPDVPLARDLEHLAGALGTDLCPVEVGVIASDEAGRRPLALASAVSALAHALHTYPEVRAVLPVDAFDSSLALLRSLPSSQPAERETALARLLARAEFRSWVDAERGSALLEVHLAPASWERKREILGHLEHFDATMLGHHALQLSGTGYAAYRAEELGLADLGSATLLSVLALAAGLGIALRRPRAWAAALAASALPLLFVAGVMGWASIPWSIALLPLPAALLAGAVDGSVHLAWRTRGRGSLPALLGSNALAAACGATLCWTSFETSRAFGLLLSLGLLVALAANWTLFSAPVRRSRRRAPR